MVNPERFIKQKSSSDLLLKAKLPEINTKFEKAKSILPFSTHLVLEDILKQQIPKWVNYSIMVMTFIILILTAFMALRMI